MRRRALAGVGAYVAAWIVASATPLFDAVYEQGWPAPAMVFLATIGMGAAVARWWAVPLAAAIGIAIVSASGGSEAIVWVLLGAPGLAIVAALGWPLGRVLGAWPAVVLFALALVPPALAGAAWLRRGEHVSPALQAALPVSLSLNQLCPGARTPPRLARRLRMRAETLLAAASRHPDDLVTYTFTYEDDPSETRDITLRQLIHENTDGPRCMPRSLYRRLRAAAA